jgi:hypothetical protein
MGRTRIGPYARWEEETRETSRRGLEALLPPAAEWPSFVEATAEGHDQAGAFDPAAAGEALSRHLEREIGGATPPAAAPPAAAQPSRQTPPGPPQEAPESTLPENLRAEIEDFLKRDKGAEVSDDEMKAYLKGAIDPNVEPDK